MRPLLARWVFGILSKRTSKIKSDNFLTKTKIRLLVLVFFSSLHEFCGLVDSSQNSPVQSSMIFLWCMIFCVIIDDKFIFINIKVQKHGQ